MTTPPAAKATRTATTRWFNGRFVAGILVVVVPIFIGARVLGSADRYAQVYVARQALVPGEQVDAADLTVGRVRFTGQGTRYIAVGRPPTGYLVTRYVGAGELLPLSALSETASPRDTTRLVTLPVGMGHAPASLARGDLVDVYVTPKSSSGAGPERPRLVISDVAVDAVAASGALASSGTVSVVLAVPVARVLATVKALESGTIDVVRVPDAAAGNVVVAPTAPPPSSADSVAP